MSVEPVDYNDVSLGKDCDNLVALKIIVAERSTGISPAILAPVGDAQLFADAPQVLVESFERERSSATRNIQTFKLRQFIQQLLCNAVGKILLILILTHVDEWQDCD